VKADSWTWPPVRIFSSSDGTAAIKIVPAPKSFSDTTGTVFTFNPDGSEVVTWSQKLVNAPYSIIVWHGFKWGTRVVTLDTWGNVGYKHALVVYGEKGQVLVDAKLEDLLTLEEIQKHVAQSTSSRWWRNGATTDFEGHGDSVKFIITLSWGKVISVNLNTGEIHSSTTTPK
jgi:hypothetical protein